MIRAMPVEDRLIPGGRLFIRSIGSAIATVFITIGLVIAGVVEFAKPPVIGAELVRARMDEEQRAAEALGFAFAQRVPLADSATSHALSLEAGECVALIAGASGHYRMTSLTILPSPSTGLPEYNPSALVAHPAIEGLVGHVQWCTDERRSVSAHLRADDVARRSFRPFSAGELRILRAPRERVSRLERGWVLKETGVEPSTSARDAGPADAGALRQ